MSHAGRCKLGLCAALETRSPSKKAAAHGRLPRPRAAPDALSTRDSSTLAGFQPAHTTPHEKKRTPLFGALRSPERTQLPTTLVAAYEFGRLLHFGKSGPLHLCHLLVNLVNEEI